MPTRGVRYGTSRLFSVVALAGAIVLIALVVLRSGGDYEVRVALQNAGQLVKGNLVKVGGNAVGKVRSIQLDDRNQAVLVLGIADDDLRPLRRGTRAIVRQTSLSGIANRYVALVPGPNNAPPIPSGGTIPAEDTQPAVDLDEVINTLDAQTRTALQSIVHGSSEQVAGATGAANAGLEALNPAVAQTAATARELVRDQSSFERFIVESAAVVSAVAPRDGDLEGGIVHAAAVADAVASQQGALDEVLRLAPPVLRRANTTLVNLRPALVEARPALREALPVAPRLTRTLEALDPVTARARPVVPQLRALVEDALPALRGLPPLERIASPTFASAARSLGEASPIVAAARAYTPDVVAGLNNGFGGVTSGYYDANGHYTRISVQGGPFSLSNAGSLVPIPSTQGTLFSFRSGLVARCPGAGTQPAPDRSNPYFAPEAPCRKQDSP